MPIKKKRTGFFGKMARFISLILALLLCASYLAPIISPASFWPIAFFGLALPYLAALNLVSLFYWIFFRKVFLLVPLIALGLGYQQIPLQLAFNVSSTDVSKSERNIRVMTYNAHRFTDKEGISTREIRDKIRGIFAQQLPDVVCIQEFFTDTAVFNYEAQIKNIIGAEYTYYHKIVDRKAFTNGLIIFSKFPIVNSNVIEFNEYRSENACIWVDIAFKGSIIRVFNVHLQSISFQPEDYEYIEKVNEKLNTETSSTKRIGSRLKSAFIKRAKQAELVRKEMDKSEYPVIVCGDFNDTPSSYSYTTIAKGLTSTFKEKGFGFAYTYTGPFPSFKIDHIICSPQFEVLSHQIIKEKIADHYPIRVDLVLK